MIKQQSEAFDRRVESIDNIRFLQAEFEVRTRVRWTREMDDVIERNYRTRGGCWCARELGLRLRQVTSRAIVIGVVSEKGAALKRKYDAEFKDKVMAFYVSHDQNECCREFGLSLAQFKYIVRSSRGHKPSRKKAA